MQNPDAPRTPFEMPEHVLPERAQAAEQAQSSFDAANNANEISDQYVLYTVIFAGVLFLGGISGKFKWRMIDAVMLGVAAIVFVIGLVILVGSPID